MKSIRRGLWDGEVGKDTRGRFQCRVCGLSLVAGSAGPKHRGEGGGEGGDSGEETVRSCPDCGRAWES